MPSGVYKRTSEHCAAIQAGAAGRKRTPFSEEHKANIGAASLGRKHTEKAKAKMRKPHGPMSEEQKAIRRKPHGPMSEEHKANIGAALKGDKHPMFDKHPSEETKKKMRENHADFTGDKAYQYISDRSHTSLKVLYPLSFEDIDEFVRERDGVNCVV